MPVKILPFIVKTQPFQQDKEKTFKSQIEKPKPENKREGSKIFFVK